MKRRVFIIHGWGDSPEVAWFPWAKEQLEAKGYEVTVPLMPNSNYPKISTWVNKIKDVVGLPKKDDVLIGHSIGCQTIWRYLEGLPDGRSVDKVIMVAPWFVLTNLEDEEWPVADPWLKTPIDFAKVKSKANSFTAIFSDDDPLAPLVDNKKIVEEKLDPTITVLKGMGHISDLGGVKELPEILQFL